MTIGPARFEFFLSGLEKLLTEADGQLDPALWLYQNGARTPVFMLEGLAKLYSGLHNKKRFGKIQAHFKLLEDALGTIDYYDSFAKDFARDQKIPTAVTNAIAAKRHEGSESLNELLHEKKWIGKDARRIGKIRKELSTADWLDERHEVEAIESVYRKAIAKINTFAAEYADGFTELETQIHELRRKLRWLSIYPQALKGCIQLTKAASRDKVIKKYLTSEIVSSPYNKMPDAGANGYILMLNKDYFLALSWMILELGRLKDLGLRAVVLYESGGISKPDTNIEAKILSDATAVCRTYFAERNLDKLVSGIVQNSAK